MEDCIIILKTKEGELTNSRPIPLEAPCTMETPPTQFEEEEEEEEKEDDETRLAIDLRLRGIATSARWFIRKSFISHFG